MSHELEAFTRRGGSCVRVLVDKSRRQLSVSTLTLDKSKRRRLPLALLALLDALFSSFAPHEFISPMLDVC